MNGRSWSAASRYRIYLPYLPNPRMSEFVFSPIVISRMILLLQNLMMQLQYTFPHSHHNDSQRKAGKPNGGSGKSQKPRRSRSRSVKQETQQQPQASSSCEQEESKWKYVNVMQYILILNDESSHIHTMWFYDWETGWGLNERGGKGNNNKTKQKNGKK